jgi:hypothetical protein
MPLTSDVVTLRLVRLFVSPADVAAERDVLDEVISRINETDAVSHRIRLEVFRWDRQVVPQIGPPPQDVVDAQTPAYDIYLGIMASRFGTPTGTFGSGTEAECRDAMERWGRVGRPWIMFYFSDDPRLSSVADVEQYLKVRVFREELQGLGIVATYSGVRGSTAGFFERVEQHLRLLIQREHARIVALPADDVRSDNPRTRPAASQRYRQWLISQCTDIDLELRRKEGHAVRLGNVYVPLAAQVGKVEVQRLNDQSYREPAPELLLDLLADESVYVSGGPGAGKSTFCRWVAWMACEEAMPAQAIVAPDGYTEQFPDSLRGRLPLLVRLRDFWPLLPDIPGRRELSGAEFLDACRHWIESAQPPGLLWTDVIAHLDAGSALVILDGVDEVPLSRGDEAHGSSPREMLLSGVIAALADWIPRGNRLLLTGRPYGLTETQSDKLEILHAPIADLDAHMQELLVRRWFHILADTPSAAERTARDLIDHIREQPMLEVLASNPLLLTAMCVIFSEGKRLPQDRYDLYSRIVDNVLFNRYPKDPAVIELIRSRLNFIAYGMHTGGGLGEDRAAPRSEITFAEIDRLMRTYREQSAWTETGFKDAVETREQLLSRSGLLLPRTERRAGFYHLSFQDFLAAQRLLDLEGDKLFDLFCGRAAAPEWRSTLSFVFGALFATSASPDRAIRVLARLIDSAAIDSVPLQVVVSDCLTILLGRKIRLQPEVEDRFRRICVSSIGREVQPIADRVALGAVLGKLGDPRIVENLRSDDAYVEVKSGGLGTAPASSSADEPFLIGRYPVVNLQYRRFIESGGYRDHQWWSDDGRAWLEAEGVVEPLLWRHGKWNGANQPTVMVSFWEAEACARWAGGRLPTESEWVIAASGDETITYPWGDEWTDGICNTAEAGLNATSPVGLFPRSRSKAFHLDDMAGNVWEWCSDVQGDASGMPRTICGGSWQYVSKFAQIDYRVHNFPGRRYDFVGFRVVRTTSPR